MNNLNGTKRLLFLLFLGPFITQYYLHYYYFLTCLENPVRFCTFLKK